MKMKQTKNRVMCLKLWIIALALSTVLLFGCIGGGSGNATPTPAQAPGATHGGSPTSAQTPAAGPGGSAVSYKEIYGWDQVAGKSFKYDWTGTDGYTTRASYTAADAGIVNGEGAIKVMYTSDIGGMTFTTNAYYSKTDSACVKTENVDGSTVDAVQCTSYELTPQSRGSLRIEPVGQEQVSVPAYSGPATKYRITVTRNGQNREHFAWVAPRFPIPVKIYDPSLDMTMALAEYPG